LLQDDTDSALIFSHEIANLNQLVTTVAPIFSHETAFSSTNSTHTAALTYIGASNLLLGGRDGADLNEVTITHTPGTPTDSIHTASAPIDIILGENQLMVHGSAVAGFDTSSSDANTDFELNTAFHVRTYIHFIKIQ